MPPRLDLNADLGESFGAWRLGDDSAMVGLVTSANVACGFHAGDALTLQRTCATAAAAGVVVGAQVGYRQLAGFGRWAVDMPSAELTADVIYQIGALDGLCRVAGTSVAYVKPHGALYNRAAVERPVADAIARAVRDVDPALALVGLANSVLPGAARALGLRALAEGFADRRYTASGLLLPRASADALIEDADEAEAQVLAMVREARVRADDGTHVAIDVDTVCLHGDSARALALARRLRAAFAREAIGVRCRWALG